MADGEFAALADPFRRELLAHCYRMLGSVHDAEDLVQETYLRAWRAYDGFEGRASLRTWLHRIATTACLTALERRTRRSLPAGLGTPSAHPEDDLEHRWELPWLEPVPDAMVGTKPAGDPAGDPAMIVTSRESIRLAFVAALQHLPPRQRAVLILRDVLRWRAAEVAQQLGTTTTAVNSALLRARAQLDAAAPTAELTTEPSSATQRELLDRYVAAFEDKDIAGIVELFSAEVVWEMPPLLSWYLGPAHIGRHLDLRCAGGLRLIPAAANGQPSFAAYQRDAGGTFRIVNIQVLTLGGEGITHVVNFLDPQVFSIFKLSDTLPA